MPKPLLITDYVDENLKLVRDGDGTDTSIQLSKDKLKIVGDLDVTGNIDSPTVYAGQILGYTDIGLNESRVSYDLTTSYVVPDDELGVSFVVPPSGNVEIMMQITFGAGSSGAGDLYAGLSTQNKTDTYLTLGSFYEEELVDQSGRSGRDVVQNYWTVAGLTPGQVREFWVGFKSSSTLGTPTVEWGGSSSGHNPDFIMKATALPIGIKT